MEAALVAEVATLDSQQTIACDFVVEPLLFGTEITLPIEHISMTDKEMRSRGHLEIKLRGEEGEGRESSAEAGC